MARKLIPIGTQVVCPDGLLGIVVGHTGMTHLVWASDTDYTEPWTLQPEDLIVGANVLTTAFPVAPADLPQEPAKRGDNLKTAASGFTVGDKVRIHSPRNYSWHNLTGVIVPSNGRKNVRVELDPGQSRTGSVRISPRLLVII